MYTTITNTTHLQTITIDFAASYKNCTITSLDLNFGRRPTLNLNSILMVETKKPWRNSPDNPALLLLMFLCSLSLSSNTYISLNTLLLQFSFLSLSSWILQIIQIQISNPHSSLIKPPFMLITCPFLCVFPFWNNIKDKFKHTTINKKLIKWD